MYRFLLTIAVFVFSFNTLAYDRVVLLAPAAGDLFTQLKQEHKVVGVTRSNMDFPSALKVGSHIKPNIELIKSLNPDLIVIGSSRFFSSEMSSIIGADTLTYNPVTLTGVQEQVSNFGRLFDCIDEAKSLNAQLSNVLSSINKLNRLPKVMYEVTQIPLTIAGEGNIVSDIISHAGGKLIAPSSRKLIKYNTESVLINQPDYYLYQVGPMNQNPQPPKTRPMYQLLKSHYLKVEQLRFSRANTQSFYLALELNRYFNQS